MVQNSIEPPGTRLDFSPNRSPSSEGPSALRGTGAALAQGKPPTSSPSQKKGPCFGMSARTPGRVWSACAVLGMGKVKKNAAKKGRRLMKRVQK